MRLTESHEDLRDLGGPTKSSQAESPSMGYSTLIRSSSKFGPAKLLIWETLTPTSFTRGTIAISTSNNQGFESSSSRVDKPIISSSSGRIPWMKISTKQLYRRRISQS